ncbi:unnamed protein product [Spirodela intermedia]|uniref:Rab-GAP TBC domain-containing protein n=1 Tax=Spirodela intermedia TaxID=51605 RepID=A0A7I8KG22_SPIIN|nr:unnamed protein product [Spirodela intermedia]
MSFDGDERRWICGRGGGVNLHRVSSIVRDIREPCLHHSPGKRSKMLSPEKWHSIFDSDGRVIAFRKALRSIILGGVDPEIRAEVWEFLLGCYALGSTSEYRKQLRIARRERYDDLIRECQMMHSSVGTGMLAYVVGSKVMDVRTPPKDTVTREEEESSKDHCSRINQQETYDFNNYHKDTSQVQKRESSSDSADFFSLTESKDSIAFDTSSALDESSSHNCFPVKPDNRVYEDQYASENFFDFPPLPVTDLFKNSDSEKKSCEALDVSEHSFRLEGEVMHSFKINNNVDLVMESNNTPLHPSNSDTGGFDQNIQTKVRGFENVGCNSVVVTRLRVSDTQETRRSDGSASNGVPASDNRVSEWLWTLHRIVVDVVRTDGHLEFYEDSKNMARMSDILAVYAWIDPATGYCQGMSDLLSPFVVLYEDNADAFWCFEMLLRRMRENFLMEGPTGVMKQLQALWKILELTDAEIFAHLSLIGAESLHFAFRMLLVLFRREISFNEALCMWEMMWAADFDEAGALALNENGLQPLTLQLSSDPDGAGTEAREGGRKNLPEHGSDGNSPPQDNEERSVSRNSFCGLARASFWARHDHMGEICTASTTGTKIGCDELPVFCVAAILIINRLKITRETQSSDDMIKIFNDKLLKINVKRCIRLAIKLRKRYFYKLTKQTSMGTSDQ